MPSAKKVGWAQLRVGIMAVFALVVVGVLIFLLTGTKPIFSDDAPLYTFMDDSAALAAGAPVRLNGILVGKVNSVRLTGETAPQRIVRVDMEVQKAMLNQIPVDSIAAISAENVLGTKYINIKKGRSATYVEPGATIASLDTREFDEVVQQGYSLLTSLQGILKRVDAIVNTVEVGQGSIGKLLVDDELYNRLIATVAEGQKLVAAMNTPTGTIGKLLNDPSIYNQVESSLTRLDSILNGIQEGRGTAGKLLKDEALHNEIQGTVSEFRRLAQDLNAGKGTAGKLLKDEALYQDLRESLAKVNSIIDRINAGQGTIGQLLVNRQLYDTLNGATAELQQLIRDVRANPKKFLRIKLALF
jgi:phospholipid/cholesterol/gamma-HCH transport system substrate-binding protein